MNRTTFATPLTTTTPKPALATPAPTSPPTRACETLMGNPIRVQAWVQMMALIRVTRIMGTSMIAGLTIPRPIVSATCTPKMNTATKLNTVAHTTARRGDSTRVETMVATELAASFIPLRKSNRRARTMAMISRVMVESARL